MKYKNEHDMKEVSNLFWKNNQKLHEVYASKRIDWLWSNCMGETIAKYTQKIILQKGHFVGTYPIKMALIGGLFGFVLVMAIFKVFKRGIINKSSLCEIEIIYKRKNVKMKALIDSR